MPDNLLVRWAGALAMGACLLTEPAPAEAFCGFYVGGAEAKLFNNATMVVLMRDGTRTVLSMENNYQGPPNDFAMVVPVPIVLQKENVKTLPREVFDRVDRLASPRLVEYWEMDPCYVPPPVKHRPRLSARNGKGEIDDESGGGHGVKIEAQFEVGEYEVVILSASDSAGLDAWLREQKYNIPAGAEPVLKPYVQQGMKFFVAKVSSKKVTFDKGQAMLSPLRFHYDTDHFALPVRLGMVNSQGTQDLLVHILADEQRYEVANFKNVTIPTNFDVANETRERFGTFYTALFDEVLRKQPGSVVTEYAWQATSCDPCPGPVLDAADLATLGADVLPSLAGSDDLGSAAMNFVLTRLHARYSKTSLGEDLVFRKAKPIVGGREMMGDDGKIEKIAQESSYNNFQGRYIIRHAWPGPINCKNPIRNRWGGPPQGVEDKGVAAAEDIAFAPRGETLATFVDPKVAERSLVSPGAPMGLAGSIGQGIDTPTPEPAGSSQLATPAPGLEMPTPPRGGCGGCTATGALGTGGAAAAVIGLALALRRLRRRER